MANRARCRQNRQLIEITPGRGTEEVSEDLVRAESLPREERLVRFKLLFLQQRGLFNWDALNYQTLLWWTARTYFPSLRCYGTRASKCISGRWPDPDSFNPSLPSLPIIYCSAHWLSVRWWMQVFMSTPSWLLFGIIPLSKTFQLYLNISDAAYKLIAKVTSTLK